MCMGFPAVKYKVFRGKPEITNFLTQGPRENSPSLHDTLLSQTGPNKKRHTTQHLTMGHIENSPQLISHSTTILHVAN